jgi:hypothetical protein
MKTLLHEFLPSPVLLRKTLESHQSWMEAKLGVALADAVILEVDIDLAQIGVEKILGCSTRADATSRAARSLIPLTGLRRDATWVSAPPGTQQAGVERQGKLIF